MGKMLRVSFLVVIDAILINFAFYSALLLRFDGNIPPNFMSGFIQLTPTFTGVFLIGFFAFGLYNRLWEYASIGELTSVVASITVAMVVNAGVFFFASTGTAYLLPRSVLIIAWILTMILIGGSRLSWRIFRDFTFRHKSNNSNLKAKPILIYGAGDAGAILAKELRSHYYGDSTLVGFIDDDTKKKNLKLLSYPILGDRTQLQEIVEKYRIEEIILAMPSEQRDNIREIVDACQQTSAKVKILPGMYDLIEGNVTVNQIREVNIEDLLGRDPIKVDLEGISDYLANKVILVTGAGGSIGSELCRQIIQFNPKKLLLLDNCENNVYEIEMELRNDYATDIDASCLVPIVKDVRDWQAIKGAFQQYTPDVVFHAAAHKHVPLMEANPEEAIKNNVMGTYHVAKAAHQFGSKRFVLVSTDKAVNPTSVMGASKRVAEMVIQHLDKQSETSFVAVRFGNVLGSRGSVVPLFKKQIAAGGPVTVTDDKMIRYFMTIPEAVQLIIQAGAMAKGGEIFVLDMGDPVKIIDLAKTMIKLSGFGPYKDIDIVITGMRPGEKLYEELLSAEEGVNATFHKRIFVAKPNGLNVRLIEDTMKNIDNLSLPRSHDDTIALLQAFIPSFRRNGETSSTIQCSTEIEESLKQYNDNKDYIRSGGQ
ncbi:polysaccharide biosynthesis protein [Desulfuribacillus stibiiarsenatis]|uniref:Polysaccharide biosynthesis protein n=1 Tax=Desulfuribacillus stibiiarsenatis TaxID=1390249 RepID=A0A1E5L5X7_9FIRM|nr:nucleoside-diphosphate sugar epimerase/dehydratase [Desulfuribacillus stibiiarsenatis]OEH85516.1 polysaccharide biosynthesis protein [Desulfuribacillus stibiiarsenatis]